MAAPGCKFQLQAAVADFLQALQTLMRTGFEAFSVTAC
jgi:hypothetical protein